MTSGSDNVYTRRLSCVGFFLLFVSISKQLRTFVIVPDVLIKFLKIRNVFSQMSCMMSALAEITFS